MAAFLIWEALVVASVVGWGWLGRCLLHLDRLPERVAVDLVLGIPVLGFVAATSILVFDLGPGWWYLLVAIGAAGMVVRSVVAIRRSVAAKGRVPWIDAGVSTAAVVVAASIATSLVVTRVWNPCDDEPAYLYLAKRLWSQGNLADGFSNRRLTSPGLFTMLQAIAIGPLHEGALSSADAFLGALLVLFVLWRRRDGSINPVGLGIALIVLTSSMLLGPANSSPVLLPFAIVLCALDPSVWRTDRSGLQNAVFVALATCSVSMMRPFLGLVPAATFVVYQLWFRRPDWPRRLAVFVLTGIVAAGPWLLLLHRDSGSWFYPVFKGNLAGNFPFDGHTARVDASHYLWRSLTDFFSTGWPLAVVLAVVVTFLLTAWASARRGEARPEGDDDPLLGRRELRVLHTLVAVFAVLFVFSISMSIRRSGLPTSFPRFWAPIVAAAVVAVFWTHWTVVIPDRRSRQVAALLCLACVGVLFVPTVNRVWTASADALDALPGGRYSAVVSEPRYPAAEAQYRAILRRIPKGARVLASVQLPHLLLRRDLDLQTMDIAGSTTPPPDFPYSGSRAAKTAWLRAHGFEYVVVSMPDSGSCLYGRGSWLHNLGVDDIYGDWTPNVLGWIDYSDAISSDAVKVSGDIGLVRVRDLASKT